MSSRKKGTAKMAEMRKVPKMAMRAAAPCLIGVVSEVQVITGKWRPIKVEKRAEKAE